ncbi:MAG: RsmB/NOP family class I SAM-dependent RNA methyltransferase, partial [Bacteroidales bacterium]|nr:RsmB/NOP family class I SAM-dependent RNA methyltransferase [Bacteroidales bacterium]
MESLRESAFARMLEDAIGAENTSTALDALESAASVSIRYNPSKKTTPVFEDKVLWSEYGRFLQDRPVFTLDPLFHAGCYYVQDSSAMFVGEISRQAMERFKDLGRPVRVLDLCAAPGGKTTDLAASLRQLFGNSFLLVANEVMKQRASVLADNVALWGEPNVVVTSVDPKAFASLEGFFDMIVADVPCSGEGMFRKDEEAVREWSEETVDLCQSRQKRIIADVWPSLTCGGIMVYSTCTFNNMENDGNVKWIADELGAEIIPSDSKYEGVLNMNYGYSLVPGLVRGEGQYCASLIKTEGMSFRMPKSSGGRETPVSGAAKFQELFVEQMSFSLRGDMLIAVPAVIKDLVKVLSALRPLRSGVAVGTLKGSTLVPDSDLALCSLLNEKAFIRAEVDKGTALAYLHRDTIVLPGVEKGLGA